MGLLKFDIGDTVTFYHENLRKVFKGIIKKNRDIRGSRSIFFGKDQFEVGNLKPKWASLKFMYVDDSSMILTRMVLTEKALWK